jgi:hypothetical protein
MSALLSYDPSLQRPLLDLVVATAWADPLVGDRQLAAVRGAQIALGLVNGEDAAAFSRGASGAWLELSSAPLRERKIAYAAAVWVALSDDLIDAGEASLLRDVRRALSLDDAAVRFADSLARFVASEGGEPHRAFSRLLVEGARRHARVHLRRWAA